MKFETAIAMHLEIKRKLYYKSQMLQTGKWGKKKKKSDMDKQTEKGKYDHRQDAISIFSGEIKKIFKGLNKTLTRPQLDSCVEK